MSSREKIITYWLVLAALQSAMYFMYRKSKLETIKSVKYRSTKENVSEQISNIRLN